MSQGTEAAGTSEAERRRAALEMIARHEGDLRRTALRFSLDAQDAEDAYQRALEIALTKAPTTELRELVRWTQKVTKHEALAVRAGRQRLLGQPRRPERVPRDPVASIPAPTEGPDVQVARREEIARSREALQALKPAELRALGLLAEGYSYAEIGELTGFSRTKVNRVLAEGRARFRGLLARSEDGRRCRDLQPLLSTFCDGEASPREAATVREHLRACAGCRSTMRTYRAAPRLAAALLPLVPPSRSLLDRAHELVANLASRLPGLGGDSATTQVAAAGGSGGAGVAALAKLVTVCAGAAGGAAACVATGVIPAPALVSEQPDRPAIERPAASAAAPEAPAVSYEPAQLPPEAEHEPKPEHDAAPDEPASAAVEPTAASAGAVEYEAPSQPESTETPASTDTPSTSGSPAGEFGP